MYKFGGSERWSSGGHAAVGLLTFGTLQGIIVAIILSLITLAYQAAHPRVSVIGKKRGADVLRPVSPEHLDDETFEGLLIVRQEGLRKSGLDKQLAHAVFCSTHVLR